MLNCLHQPWYQKKFSWPLLKLFPHTTGFQNINDVWTPLWTFQSWKVDKVDGSYPIRKKKKGFTRPLDAHKREAGFALNIQLLFSKRKCAKKNNFTKLIITLIFRQPYTTWKGSMALVYHSPFLFNQIFGSGVAQAIYPFTTVYFGSEVQSQFASLEIEPGFFGCAVVTTFGEAGQINHKKNRK